MDAETGTQSLSAEIQQLRTDIARIAATLRTLMRERSGETLEGAEDAAQRLFEEARRRTNGIAHEIEQKPVAAALGAFGIGLLLGTLFSARRG